MKQQKLSELVATLHGETFAPAHDQATLLFADICGSTGLFERYGDLRARQIEAEVLELLASCTVDNQGTVVKTIGDEIMSHFPNAACGVQAACEMQLGVKDDAMLAELGIAIRVGLHHGPVLFEKDDVFGDAVNVAARMVALAKADQIITTKETVAALSTRERHTTRNLGSAWVRGKQNEVEIAEVIWHETGSLTQLSSGETEKILRNQLYARLHLSYREQNLAIAPSAQIFTIGRSPKSNLVVERELVSRTHASIEFRQGKFIFKDNSINGTHLLLENGTHFFLRREEIALHERGVICLGQAAFDNNPDVIRYECKYVE